MSYGLFLEEYLTEAKIEMNKYLDSTGYTEAAKEGVYKHNFYLRDNLQKKYVSEVLAKESSRDTIMEFVGKVWDDHHRELSTAGPTYSFVFGDKEVSVLYELFNITKEEILQIYDNMVKETYYGNISKFITGWITNAPHKLLITAILSDAYQNNYEDIIEACEWMWGFSEYAIVFSEFWHIGVKEDVMDYTIEHLSRNIITKVKSIGGLLKYDAHAATSFYADEFRKGGADNVYIDMMRRMRNQISNKFRKIANAYYDNYRNNASQHSTTSKFDDGSVAELDGVNNNSAQLIDRITSKFITGGINDSYARITAEAQKLDKDTLIGFISQIMSTKNNYLPKFIENTILAYFNKYPTADSLSEFVNFGLALYRSIGTSKDELYMELKNIINYWMNDIVHINDLYKSPNTIINYHRAVFNYVILMINYYK